MAKVRRVHDMRLYAGSLERLRCIEGGTNTAVMGSIADKPTEINGLGEVASRSNASSWVTRSKTDAMSACI